MKRALLAAISSIALCSCVGLSIEYDHTGKDRYAVPSSTRLRVASVAGYPVAPVITRQMILDAWGKPNRSTVSNGVEIWTYDDDHLVWNGLFIALVIPIPLVVPVGHNYVAIQFKDGVVTGVETRSQGETGFLCPTLKNVHTLELGCDTNNSPRVGDIPVRFYGGRPLTDDIKRKTPRIVPREETPEPEERQAPGNRKSLPAEGGTMGLLLSTPKKNPG